MNRILGSTLLVLCVALLLVAGTASAKNNCTRIKDGVLKYSAGHYLAGKPLKVGYDVFGYNYEARKFNGIYANAYLGRYGFPPYKGDDEAYLEANPTVVNNWAWPYRDVKLSMKWNDAWLSNKDCDGDGALDRHAGHMTYIGSGAWLTNHMSGKDGTKKWTYFTKIIAAPTGGYVDGGYWYTASDKELGPVIWGSFATIQEVESGQGKTYGSPAGPGLGKGKP